MNENLKWEMHLESNFVLNLETETYGVTLYYW